MSELDDFQYKPLTKSQPNSKPSQSPDSQKKTPVTDFQLPHMEIKEFDQKSVTVEALKRIQKNRVKTAVDQQDQDVSQKQLTSEPQKKTYSEPEVQYVKSYWSPVTFLLDGVFVAAMTLILLIINITVTGIDLVALMLQAEQTLFSAGIIALLFVSSYTGYLLATRCYAGATLAEWAIDVRLGTKKQQRSFLFPIQVFVRIVLTLATGLILFPLLSRLLKRDVLGDLVRVKLQQKALN